MELVIHFIKPEFLVLSAVIFIMAEILKKTPAWPKLGGFYPLYALGVAVVISLIYVGVLEGWSGKGAFVSILQGVFVAALPVLFAESFSKLFQKKSE